MADYFSFEEVMGELEVTEDDLKRMVSEGELRAFRDENKMKFKREDVEGLKKGRITEPTIILPSASNGETSTETIIDFDIDNAGAGGDTTFTQGTVVELPPEDATGGITGAMTAEIGPTQTLKIEGVDSSSTISIDPTKTHIEEDDSVMMTEPLKLADEQDAASDITGGFTAELVEETLPPPPTTKTSKFKKREVVTIPPEVEAELERRKPNPVWAIVMLLVLLISLCSFFFYYDLMRMENEKVDQPMTFVADIAEWIMEGFWGDSQWIEYHESEHKVKEENRLKKVDDRYPELYRKPTFRLPDTAPKVPRTDEQPPAGAGKEGAPAEKKAPEEKKE